MLQIDDALENVNSLAHEIERDELAGVAALQPPKVPYDDYRVRNYIDALNAVLRPSPEIADKDLLAAFKRVQALQEISRSEFRRHALRRKEGYQDLRRFLDCSTIGYRLYREEFSIRHRIAQIRGQRANKERAAGVVRRFPRRKPRIRRV